MVKISIVLPTARENYPMVDLPNTHLFEPTIKSLLNQSFTDFELIVVDHLYRYRKNYFKNLRLPFKVKHIPPKPCIWHKYGMWSLENSLNTGIMHCEGELFIRIDDCSEFPSDYLENIWRWYKRGFYVFTLIIYYRGGKKATYDELYKKYIIEMKKQLDPYTEIDRTIKILDKMYKKGEIIRDSRWSQVEKSPTGIISAPGEWAYGYIAIPLNLLLKINGYNELFSPDKSLEDVELGIRIEMVEPDRFILDKKIYAIENLHKPPSKKVLFYNGKPMKCNYAILRLTQMKKRWRANSYSLTDDDIE